MRRQRFMSAFLSVFMTTQPLFLTVSTFSVYAASGRPLEVRVRVRVRARVRVSVSVRVGLGLGLGLVLLAVANQPVVELEPGEQPTEYPTRPVHLEVVPG